MLISISLCYNFDVKLSLRLLKYGTIQKLCHSPRGRGLTKKMTKCDIGVGGASQTDVTPSKNNVSAIALK